jgi:S1-C subfamily serine protease
MGELPEAASSEIQRFEPPPAQRLQWRAAMDRGSAPGPDPATPERWFEPPPAAPDEPPAAAPASAGSYGRGFVAVLLITSLVASVIGAGGTYLALRASGALESHQATLAGVNAQNVTIESDSSTVIAAVNKVSPAVVQIVANDGAGNTYVGSGIIYDVRGWILTNKHVVAGAKTITIRLQDDRRVAGKTYGVDTLTDLAIIKIDGAYDIKSVPLGDSSSLQVGQMVIAIGSPLGLAYPNSSTEGIVSALGRDISVAGDTPATANNVSALHGLIQTDAAINPGNSGGPLIDASGRVVGITTASDQTATGIGFAIPINIAKPIMQQALAGEKLSRPFIGVSYYLIDRGLATDYNLPLQNGAWVHKEDSSGASMEAVVPGSPGDLAGIKTGDIITSVEGQAIDPLHRLEDMLVQYAPGRTISIELYRAGTKSTVRVTLGTRPDNAG